MTTLSAQPYKGTRDYYPEQKQLQNYIFSIWRKVVESFGYEEYGAPLLEPLELYAAKSGQELVNDQTYTFNDRGGRTVAVRPEMTPSISRMVAARRQELAYPARLYSIANFMRYERPQRGREREFWQLNVDIFGVDNIRAESEIIFMADSILKEFGATDSDYKIRINHRKLINYVMAQYLCLDQIEAQKMIKLFDRKDKISQEDFESQVLSICQSKDGNEILNKINILINAKSMNDLPDSIKQSTAVEEIQRLFTRLEKFGVKSAVFDITLMRGLDYYTGTVFEVFDTHPDNNRAMFGGGRYDGLVGLFGVDPISAVGMAPGETMFENFLTVHNLIPDFKSHTDLYVILLPGSENDYHDVVKALRAQGLNVEVDISGKKADKQIKTAVKKRINYIISIGGNEIKTNQYPIKNLSNGQTSTVLLNDVSSAIH
jgi:histidyl-tRNA synthetase